MTTSSADAYQKAFNIIKRKYKEEYDQLVRLYRSEILFNGNKDSVRETSRHKNAIYYSARKALTERYFEEYIQEVRKLRPLYVPKAVVKWEIREYNDKVNLYYNRNLVFSSPRMSAVLDFIRKGI